MGLSQWLASKLSRRRAAHPTAEAQATDAFSADAPFALDTAQPIESKVAQLADYVRELRALSPPIGCGSPMSASPTASVAPCRLPAARRHGHG